MAKRPPRRRPDQRRRFTVALPAAGRDNEAGLDPPDSPSQRVPARLRPTETASALRSARRSFVAHSRQTVLVSDVPVILVSACLLGTCCNHEGRASLRPRIVGLGDSARLVPICPEVVGGLTTPRPAAELVGGDGADVLAAVASVRTGDGDDVTAAYVRGARAAVELARGVGATRAILKARSPSCGSVGVTAAALRAAGITVESDEDTA
jgi:uncharacterized protein YbbK (DUF523 family)